MFNDVSGKQGLIQECETNIFGDEGYGRISGNTNLLATFTRLLNEAQNTVASILMKADGQWQWDDNNNTDFPIATTSLITTLGSEQQDYAFDITFLKILRVEVLDNTGAWRLLKPIDMANIYDESLTDFLKQAGLPEYYDKIANSIFLYPKPLATSVTSTNGLKVYFQRPPSYFTVADTTKTPGFYSIHHRLVALIASRDYAIMNSLTPAQALGKMVDDQSEALAEDVALRNKDDHIRLSGKQFLWR